MLMDMGDTVSTCDASHEKAGFDAPEKNHMHVHTHISSNTIPNTHSLIHGISISQAQLATRQATCHVTTLQGTDDDV